MTAFDSLPELWVDLVDALTGLVTVEVGASVLTSEWELESWDAFLDTGELVVQIPTRAAVAHEWRCPQPADTRASRLAVVADANWRKAPHPTATAEDLDAWYDAQELDRVLDLRDAINALLWPSGHHYQRLTFPWTSGDSTGEPIFGLTVYLTMSFWLSESFTRGPDFWPNAFNDVHGFTGTGELDVDLAGFAVVRVNGEDFYAEYKPAYTDDPEANPSFKTFLQFPAAVFVALGPELTALDLLATRLNGLASSVIATDAKGRTLVQRTGPTDELEDSAPDADTVLRRLARGVENIVGSDLQVRLANGSLVSLQRGVMLEKTR